MCDEAIKIMKTMDEYKDCPDDVLEKMTIDDINPTPNVFDALALDADDISYLKEEGLLDSISALSNKEREKYRKRNLSSWI